MAKARVIATGRIGTVLTSDLDDDLLSYKLSFDDGRDPSVDWFSKHAVSVIERSPGGGETPEESHAAPVVYRPSHLIELNTITGRRILKTVNAGLTTTRELKETILTADDFPGCRAVSGMAIKPPVCMIRVLRESGEVMQDSEVVLDLPGSTEPPANEPLARLLLLVTGGMEFPEMLTFLRRCPYIAQYVRENGREPDVPQQVIVDFCCFFYQCALMEDFGPWASAVYWNFTPSALKGALYNSFPHEVLQYIGL